MVVSGSPTHKVNGMPVARKGDMVDCPQYYPDGRPHGRNPIIEGAGSMLIDGLPVALHGHHSECGCELLAVSAGAPVPNASQYRPPNETDKEKKSQLFGTNRPDLDKLSQDPAVRGSMDNAWKQTLQDGQEHGGWIIRDTNNNEIYTLPFQNGSADSIGSGDRPYGAIATFHTHPTHPAGDFVIRVPTGADQGASANQQLSGIVRSAFGNYNFGPQNAPEIYPGQKIEGMEKATYTFDNQHMGDRQQVDEAAHERMKTDQQNSRPKVADDPSSPDSLQSELMGYSGGLI
jgi:uncharacterized Zn-binding protein involved in type VI secretion